MPASTLNLTPSLSQAIPGFQSNTATSSALIKQLMAGKLTNGERSSIYDAGAERATLGGMPGSSGRGGSLFANADLRNIGLQAGQRQQQGFQDFLAQLQGFSGTVVPTAGQELQNNQFNQSQAQQESQFGRNLQLQQDQNRENKRRFDFTNFINRPYSSTRSGDTYDARGNRLGTSTLFKY